MIEDFFDVIVRWMVTCLADGRVAVVKKLYELVSALLVDFFEDVVWSFASYIL